MRWLGYFARTAQVKVSFDGDSRRNGKPKLRLKDQVGENMKRLAITN